MNTTEKVTERMCAEVSATMKVVHRNQTKNHLTICKNSLFNHGVMSNHWSNYMNSTMRSTTGLVVIREKVSNVYQNNAAIHIEEKKLSSKDEKFLSEITQYIQNNIDNPELGVHTIMAQMNVSRTHLHRKLKELSGLSTTEFIRTIRLRKAAQLLRNKVDNISQIAYQTGFSDCSYFTKCFKKQYGVSPTNYLK